MKKVHGLSLGGGASQGDREGASREVGGEPGEGGGDPGSQEGEMNFTCYGEARKVTPVTSQHTEFMSTSGGGQSLMGVHGRKEGRRGLRWPEQSIPSRVLPWGGSDKLGETLRRI